MCSQEQPYTSTRQGNIGYEHEARHPYISPSSFLEGTRPYIALHRALEGTLQPYVALQKVLLKATRVGGFDLSETESGRAPSGFRYFQSQIWI